MANVRRGIDNKMKKKKGRESKYMKRNVKRNIEIRGGKEKKKNRGREGGREGAREGDRVTISPSFICSRIFQRFNSS